MSRSQPDGTTPLPETAEVGGEGGSFGDSASRASRERPGEGPERVKDTVLTDVLGNVARLPEVINDPAAPSPGDDLKKHPNER